VTTERALLDVNVLVALATTSHVHHRAAHRALAGMDGWATTSLTELGLLRLLLNPQVTGTSWSAPEVLRVLRGMHRDPRWSWVPDDVSPVDAVVDLDVLVGHRQVTDLHLVDLAARHGLVLASFDASLAESLAPGDREHVRLLPLS